MDELTIARMKREAVLLGEEHKLKYVPMRLDSGEEFEQPVVCVAMMTDHIINVLADTITARVIAALTQPKE